MSHTILFVDEEQFVQKALQRSLRKMRRQWDMHFVSSPREAARVLVSAPVDVLVTETVFTGGSGLRLLEAVRRNQPQVVRIILSGYADRDIILQSVDIAHQYLAKPCEVGELKTAINRAFMMKTLLDRDDLKRIISQIDALPSLPSLYVALMDELSSQDASIQRVGDIIARDIGLTAKVLKLVNASCFGIPQHVSSPVKAAGLLGLDLIQAIALAHGTFDKFKHASRTGFSMDQMWHHAAATAACAKTIARLAGADSKTEELAYIAGLLHDLGKLLIAAYLPESFGRILDRVASGDADAAEAETAVLGTTHASVGAYLLGLWGLPDPIIEAVAFHHHPCAAINKQERTPVMVHVANAFANADPGQLAHTAAIDGIDAACLAERGLAGELNAWRSGCVRHLEQMPSPAEM